MAYTLTNERLLRQLVYNDQAINEFQFLRQTKAAAPPEGCSTCEQKKYATKFRQAAEQAKATIAGFDAANAAKLKTLLGLPPGETIKIYWIQDRKTQTSTI